MSSRTISDLLSKFNIPRNLNLLNACANNILETCPKVTENDAYMRAEQVYLPIYDLIKSLITTNFSKKTLVVGVSAPQVNKTMRHSDISIIYYHYFVTYLS
jgi:hypothetical protein